MIRKSCLNRRFFEDYELNMKSRKMRLIFQREAIRFWEARLKIDGMINQEAKGLDNRKNG